MIKVENELITDFDNIANTQLSYLKLTQDGLDPTLNLLKNVNQLCEHQNFSNEKQAVQEIGEALQKIQESGMPDMFNRSEKEEKLESTEEITDFNEAIETLRSIKSDLAAGLKLKDLITKVSAAFKNQIQDDDFKKLEQKLQEIADKQDLDGFAKFLDKAIEFFKSIVGKV